MRIGIVGGRERNALTLERVAAERGHELEVHDGDTSGRGVAEIRALVRRSDLVIVLTDVNSHGAVHAAREAARRSGTPLTLLRKVGLGALTRAFEHGGEAALLPRSRVAA
jgi:hypothetical protein